MKERMISTYSMWNLFRNCRKAFAWRYLNQLVPLEHDRNLTLGSLIHKGLEHWHRTRELGATLELLDRALIHRTHDPDQHRDWQLARAMLQGYAARYPQEDFTILALEKTFQGKIINPSTGAASRSFTLAGKVDGLVRLGGEFFLLEHKTASVIDSSYLEKLWTDFQIILYSYYLEQSLDLPIAGVIYNILVKARLQQGPGETEAEFEARRVELLAKSKTGITTAKRKVAETNEAFQERLAAKYADPSMFHRETIYLSRDQFTTLRTELWELTQAYLDARRRGVWYQNTSYCFHYGRPCPYFAICRSGGSSNVIENLYERRAPHEELQDGLATENVPIF